MKKNLLIKFALAVIGLAVAFFSMTNSINNRIDAVHHRLDEKIELIDNRFDVKHAADQRRYKKLLELELQMKNTLEGLEKTTRAFNDVRRFYEDSLEVLKQKVVVENLGNE